MTRKSFTEFVESAGSGDKKYMPHDFKEWEKPATYLKNDKQRGRYLDALRFFEASYADGKLYNARFGEHYTSFTRGLETAYDVVKDNYRPVFAENQPHRYAEDTDSLFALNSIKKIHKHFSQPQYREKYAEIYHFLDTIIKLPDFIKDLKGMIIKGKEPKPVDPNKFVKPMVPYDALKKASAFFVDAIAEVRAKYYDEMESYLLKDKEKLVAMLPMNSMEFYKKVQSVPLKMMGQRILKSDGYKMNSPMELVPEWKNIVRKMAERAVDDIIQAFIHKNSNKLGLVFQKKSDIVEHKINYTRVNQSNLENSMYFKFDDNSSFTIYTSTIYGYKQSGTVYVQYPTRFSDVTMADGTKMAMPSEEKMIKDF